jgi:4-hydroxy-2,2'-bipyrrole-5-carbaldehyde O-methyltransferase
VTPLHVLLTLLRAPDLRARLALRRDVRALIRLQFLAAGAEIGILSALQERCGTSNLGAALGIVDRNLLETFLDLGVAVGELDRRDGGYRLRGAMAHALVRRDGGDAMRAALTELVDYHATVYRVLGRHLAGNQGTYLEGRAELIAQSSRTIEPVLGAFVQRLVRRAGPIRVLELGCGSGVYLRRVAEENPQATGIGVDLEPAVVATARRALHSWGIDDRFAVRCGDARTLPDDLGGSFDLVTLYNNLYYVEPDQRPALFERLRRQLLAPDGRLVVVSMMRGSTVLSLDLDLILSATRGCTPLPREPEVISDLRNSGFRRIRRWTLLPGEPLRALVAHAD